MRGGARRARRRRGAFLIRRRRRSGRRLAGCAWLAGRLAAAGCLAGCLSLAACSGWSGALVRVDTAHPDVAAYAERFNLAQDRYLVLTRYVDGPAELLARGGSDADVLIGPALAGGGVARRVRPLDRLFRSGRMDDAAFFPGLLRSGRVDGVQRALPLSFGIPLVVVRARDGGFPPFAVTPEQLAALPAAALGWDAELVYRSAVFYGAGFRLLPDGRIGFEPGAVGRAVDLARRVTAAAAGGPVAPPLLAAPPDGALRNGPPRNGALAEMLLGGRIDFFLTDLQGFLDIPRERRGLLGFRWFGAEDGLQPGGVTWAAIRAGARNRRGAESFLTWLFDPATQAALLDLSRAEQLTGFGIAGGLPSLAAVAAREAAVRYPFMLGRTPAAAEVAAPAALSADWGALRHEVVLPWLRAAVQGVEQPPLAQAIDDRRRRRSAAADTVNDAPAAR